MKEKIDIAQDGVFRNLKSLRDKLYGEKAKAYDTPAILGVERVRNIMFVENSDDFWEVANQKECELLGIIYYHNPWKKYVWEQCVGIIMAEDCMGLVKEKMVTLKEGGLQNG